MINGVIPPGLPPESISFLGSDALMEAYGNQIALSTNTMPQFTGLRFVSDQTFNASRQKFIQCFSHHLLLEFVCMLVASVTAVLPV